MVKERKILMPVVLLSVCLILIIILFLNVSINGKPFDAGGTICISFDKWDMMRADKIVFAVGGETYTVTDAEFIRAFSQETLAGTFHEYCCSNLNEGRVEIYRGERLLRRMRYIANHDAFAYEADITHWVLFGKEGHAFLSKDMWEKLHSIIGR